MAGKEIKTTTDANRMLLGALRGMCEDLRKSGSTLASGRDEAVIAKASERDRSKFIRPFRMN